MTPTSNGRLSPATLQLWAKSDRGKESGRWHPLICHLLDVAASCLEIIDLEPARYRDLLAQDLQTTPERAVALTAALIGLHDLGKANAWFQRKSESCLGRVKDAGFDFPPLSTEEIPHGIISMAYLYQVLTQLYGLNHTTGQLLADAVGAHHGFRTSDLEFGKAMQRIRKAKPIWTAAVDQLFEEVWEVCGAPEPEEWTLPNLSAAAFQRLMGLTSVADWIGSSLDFSTYGGDSKAYLEQARGRARERLRQVGWSQRLPLRGDADFGSIFSYLAPPGTAFSPRGLQKAVVDALDGVTEPVLLLVEAPMGEGKTEASFYAHIALQNAVGHRGAYVGLPSQATGNAMFERLHAFLKAQGREQAPDLQLLHGAQLLNDGYQELIIRSNHGEDENVVAKSYFTHLKRALLSEYGAGTIDQALLGILPVKHQFVRLWGLGNRTVILDEVHAYDTYTGNLLLALVRWLRALGSSVILMSATLPRATREQMLEAFAGAPVLTSPPPYPRLALVHQGQVKETTFRTRPLACFGLEKAPVEVEALAETAADLVRDGGCLACIVNTVERAQQLYLALSEQLGPDEVMLFHARFPIEQKQRIETEVLRRFGKGEGEHPNAERPRRAVLVATQVVEQSLDLDFDVMITDLAPIDLILQRAGRLHRHDKNRGRRGRHERAVLLVSGLGTDDPREGWEKHTTYWDVIYHPSILVRTWLELKALTQVDLKDDLDPLVQCVYDASVRLQGQDAYDEYLIDCDSKASNQEAIDKRDAKFAELGNPDSAVWEAVPRKAWEDDSQGPLLTRKTQETVTVVPLYRVGEACCLDPTGEIVVPIKAKLPLALAKTVFGRTVKISRLGVVKALQAGKRLPWSETPLLQNVYPLYFDEDGQKTLGKTTVTLEPELGLVYRKGDSQ